MQNNSIESWGRRILTLMNCHHLRRSRNSEVRSGNKKSVIMIKLIGSNRKKINTDRYKISSGLTSPLKKQKLPLGNHAIGKHPELVVLQTFGLRI